MKSDDDKADGSIALCASCDRCRARKTRCDGKRPCGNCASKYMKKNKLKSIEGIDISCFECVYSPAKRRGPVPGKMGQVRKASEALQTTSPYDVGSATNGTSAAAAGFGAGGIGATPGLDGVGGAYGADEQQQQQLLALQQQRQMMLAAAGTGNANLLGLGGALGAGGAAAAAEIPGIFESAGLSQQQQAIQQQLNYLQQLHVQQQQLSVMGGGGGGNAPTAAMDTTTTTSASSVPLQSSQTAAQEPVAQRQKSRGPVSAAAELEDKKATTVLKNTALLDRDSAYGNRLRSYYHLSVDELFGLPHIPSDEEYAESLNVAGMTGKVLPQSHKSALQAARFAEIALGALVHNEVTLAMELSNASVSCLKQCIITDTANRTFLFEVARAYFLLGCFRAFRGDMERYLKYRRVCMQHVSQIEDSESDQGPQLLVAAISYLDCWSYMVHNADEKKLPSIDDSIPRVEHGSCGRPSTSETEKEYGVSFATTKIVSDPKNQNWMQGAPPIFLNNEAPLNARSLDALSCAFRSCCDQANGRFAQMAAAVAAEQGGDPAAARSIGGDVSSSQEITATTSAVMAHEDELCSRNMVLSACTLLQQHESSTSIPNKNQGLHLIISAMDAFLENGDEDGSGGFTDSQIQSLLSVCNTTIENPFLLHHGGPTYHMISNAAILLCHLLNGMHAMRAGSNGAGGDDSDRAMEAAVFEEVYDTFISVRKLLNMHRRKLPVKLRCHGIPRPSVHGTPPDKPFIDLGETLMCGCRGCQGFVLMACSPCVAAERARSTNMKREIEANREGGEDQVELDKELNYLEAEFDLDDDALLNMLSRIISN